MTVNKLVGKGLYSAREAARLTHVPVSTIRRWMFGYKNKDKSYAAIWSPEVNESDTIGFHDLLEIKLVHEFRQHGLSINIIRQAARIAREDFGTDYPFSRQRFHTDGKEVFLEAASQVEELNLIEVISKQYVVENIYRSSFVKSIEFSNTGDPDRWYPMPDDDSGKIIVLDPERAFGKPILTESGIPTRVLFDAYRNGDSARLIAASFGTSPEEVEKAVLYETRLHQAAA